MSALEEMLDRMDLPVLVDSRVPKASRAWLVRQVIPARPARLVLSGPRVPRDRPETPAQPVRQAHKATRGPLARMVQQVRRVLRVT